MIHVQDKILPMKRLADKEVRTIQVWIIGKMLS